VENHCAIQVQGLQKRFGEIRAVQDVSFDVTQGEIFSLLGVLAT
jgi:ABC-type multidrug transport system ATPase subunit